MKGVRILWTFFKKGFVEFSFFLSPLQLGLTLYTALILTFSSVTHEVILILLVLIGALSALGMGAFGRWQYYHRRSFYKKDAETEALNNPYSQAINIMMAKIADASGVDVSDVSEFKRKWIKKQEIEA